MADRERQPEQSFPDPTDPAGSAPAIICRILTNFDRQASFLPERKDPMANNDPKNNTPPIPEAPAPTAIAEQKARDLIEFHLHPEKMNVSDLLDIDDL